MSVVPPGACRQTSRSETFTRHDQFCRAKYASVDRVHPVGTQAPGWSCTGLKVTADPVAQAVLPAEQARQARPVFVGYDESGRALEVMAVRTHGELVVIYAMDLRPKWRTLYEEAKR